MNTLEARSDSMLQMQTLENRADSDLQLSTLDRYGMHNALQLTQVATTQDDYTENTRSMER